MENIRGTVDTIVFASTDNRFTVLKMTPEKRSTKITVILNSAAPLVGQLLEVEGEWTQHPKFGQQFKAVSCRAVAVVSKLCQNVYPRPMLKELVRGEPEVVPMR